MDGIDEVVDLTTPCPVCKGPMVLDVDTDRAYCDTEACPDHGVQLTWLELLARIYPLPRPAVQAITVPRGSLVVLTDVELGESIDDVAQLVDGLVQVLGHHEFCVVTARRGAAVEVWGPDTDLEARFAQLLEVVMPDQPNAITGVPEGARLIPGPDDQAPKRRIPVAPDDEPTGGPVSDAEASVQQVAPRRIIDRPQA